MNEQANISLLKQAYDAYQRGDIQTILGMAAQDIEWELPEVEGIPFTGKRRGVDQVAEFFRILAECQEPREYQPERFIAQDDQVVVQGHARFAVKATGVEFGGDWCHVFRITGGKIASFKEYDDTHQAAQAYQPRGAGAGATAPQPSVH